MVYHHLRCQYKNCGFPLMFGQTKLWGGAKKNVPKTEKHHNFKPIGIIILFLVFNVGAFWK